MQLFLQSEHFVGPPVHLGDVSLCIEHDQRVADNIKQCFELFILLRFDLDLHDDLHRLTQGLAHLLHPGGQDDAVNSHALGKARLIVAADQRLDSIPSGLLRYPAVVRRTCRPVIADRVSEHAVQCLGLFDDILRSRDAYPSVSPAGFHTGLRDVAHGKGDIDHRYGQIRTAQMAGITGTRNQYLDSVFDHGSRSLNALFIGSHPDEVDQALRELCHRITRCIIGPLQFDHYTDKRHTRTSSSFRSRSL